MHYLLSVPAFAPDAARPTTGADAQEAARTAIRTAFNSKITNLGDFSGQLLSLVMLNVLLGVFNLIPLPPLDGASVAMIFLPSEWRARVQEWTATGMLSPLGILVAWQVFPELVPSLFRTVMAILRA